ncbi:hypothetical protein GOP47_0029025 [Adiantum capillus-veneris]|nr:hypothetical protein GOP47_0029025 [Adiantum capillus-veneris]
MVSSASSKQRTLDPAARDFVPCSHEPVVDSFSQYPQHIAAARPDHYSFSPFTAGAHFSPFTSSECLVPPVQHVSFPTPPALPALPSSMYEWQPNVAVPPSRFYGPEWPSNNEALSHQGFHAGQHVDHAQALHQQQVLPYHHHHHHHHQPLYSAQSGQQHVFHSQNQQLQLISAATGGHDNRLQLQLPQHYGDQYPVYQMPAPQFAAPPLLQAPMMAWETSPTAPALGQPAYPAVKSPTTVAIPRVSGSAQPFMGRDRMSRALQLIGVPTEMSEAQLTEELGLWGEIRALDLSRHSEGLITIHYFDLRSAKNALSDIQNQHLLHQQRVQQQISQDRRSQQLHVSPSNQSPPPDRTSSPAATPDVQASIAVLTDQLPGSQVSAAYSPTSVDTEAAATLGRGLVGGKPVWAHYTIPVGLDTEDCLNQGTLSSLNQGTLVVFNLDASMHADVVKGIFDGYGRVKEVREAPQRRHHKFVEFYDVRHAALALQALDGTEIEGKKLKIEFSRPGGSTAKRGAVASALPRMASSSPIIAQNIQAIGHHSAVAMPPLPVQYPLTPPNNVYWQHVAMAQPEAASVAAGWSHPSSGGGALLPAPGPLPSYEGYASNLGPSSMQNVPIVASTLRLHPMDASRDHHLAAPLYRVVPPRQAAPIRRGTLTEHASAGEGRARGDASDRPKRRDIPLASASSSSLLSSSPWRSHLGARRGAAAAAVASMQQANDSFRFDENEAESSGRTTLMIRNIPNKYTQEMLIAMLDDHCMEMNSSIGEPSDGSGEPISAFDFVYLPIDFKNRCNLGYAFVNLTTPQATLRLHKAFHGRQWDEFNSRKICEVSYARLQGREALEEHFKNSRFVCDMDEYLPVKFSPPRSGRPIPSTSSSVPASASASASASAPRDASAAAHDLVSEENAPEEQKTHNIEVEGDAAIIISSSPPQSDCQSSAPILPSSTPELTASTPMPTSSSTVSIVSQGIILGRRVHGYRHAGILQHHEP